MVRILPFHGKHTGSIPVRDIKYKKMLSKHLFLTNFYELKLRVFYILFTFLITFITCYFYCDNILYLLTNSIFKYMKSQRFIYTNLIEMFYINIKISLIIAIICLIFILIIHFYLYFFNALYKYEQNLFKKLVIYNNIIILCIISIFYYYIIPYAWTFFLYYENNLLFPLHFEAKLTNYLNFLLTILINIFIIFQSIFIIISLLILNNKINLNFLRKRKFIYTIFLLLGTLLTPPDVASQLLFLIIFIIFYEIFLFIIIYYLKVLEERQAE